MPPQQNPHEAQPPDHGSQAFQVARQRLVDRYAITHQEAAQQLLDIWHDLNRVARQEWDAQQARLAEQRRIDEELAQEERDENQRRQREEEDEANKEDRKKNRTKFLPYANIPPPSTLPITPSPLALRKLGKGEYVELYFFTNKGLADAQDFAYSVDDDAFTLMPDENGTHSFVPIAAAKAKQAIVPDKDLSWNQIDEALHRMLQAMKDAKWPAERVQDTLKFWMNLATHEWRHDPDETAQQALIIYQATYRRRWHDSLGTASSFNLRFINQEALVRIKAKIVDQRRLAIDQRAKEAADRLEMTAARASSSYSTSYANSAGQYRDNGTASKVAAKRAMSLSADTAPSHAQHKRQKSFRPTDKGAFNSDPLPPCAVCLSIEPHKEPVVECARERTWDGKFEAFAKRVLKTLVACTTNQRLCSRWQRRESCTDKHVHAHLCSGCGSATHGAFQCPRRQKHQGADSL